jgi:hypothetical protein
VYRDGRAFLENGSSRKCNGEINDVPIGVRLLLRQVIPAQVLGSHFTGARESTWVWMMQGEIMSTLGEVSHERGSGSDGDGLSREPKIITDL